MLIICCNSAKVLCTPSSIGANSPSPPSAVPTIRHDLSLHFLSKRAPRVRLEIAAAEEAILLLDDGGGGAAGGGGGGGIPLNLLPGGGGGGGLGGGGGAFAFGGNEERSRKGESNILWGISEVMVLPR